MMSSVLLVLSVLAKNVTEMTLKFYLYMTSHYLNFYRGDIDIHIDYKPSNTQHLRRDEYTCL